MVHFHRGGVIASALIAAGLLAAGCASSSASSGAQAAKSNISALATSPAVIHARQVAQAEVINPCKPNLPSIRLFLKCAENKLGIEGDSPAAQAKRGALESCIFEAGAADHVLTSHTGRLHFEQVGAPECASQILLANASTSPSPSGSHT